MLCSVDITGIVLVIAMIVCLGVVAPFTKGFSSLAISAKFHYEPVNHLHNPTSGDLTDPGSSFIDICIAPSA